MKLQPSPPDAEDDERLCISSLAEDSSAADADRAEAVLSALNDPNARAVLEETVERPLSAMDIAEACDMPMSTVYRKLEFLTELDLLETYSGVSSAGNRHQLYQLRLDSIELELTNNQFELRVSHTA
jgi:DNA-binding transcriptional ArsR family regulator